LINNVRQIKDRKGNPLTFINFDDGSGTMDGIVSSDVLENCHNLLKEGSILNLKGNVEVDDYRTNDLGSLMFRMRVKEVSAIDHELDKKVNEVLININNSEAFSLEEFSKILDSVDKNFWNNGTCRLNVKVSSENSEAIIDIGDNFKFNPTLENLFYLEDLFGKNILEI
jgi:DNA polymerase-3 subunit alpha